MTVLVEINNVSTNNSTWVKLIENIINLKNVVIFLRTLLTQMRTSEFSVCTSPPESIKDQSWNKIRKWKSMQQKMFSENTLVELCY